MKRRGLIGAVLLLLCATLALVGSACARTPPGALVLAGRAEEGVRRMQQNAESLITALADIQRAAIDDAWESDYARAEALYRQSRGLADDPLSPAQRAEIAAVAAAARERSLARIAAREAELVHATRASSEAVVQMQSALTAHLLSIRSAQRTRQELVALLDSMTGLDLAPALADLRQTVAALEEDTQGRD